jgi:DedD protein
MPDRALKERIIGAIVLVVFAVLVVPVFLDGTSDEQEIVSESVTLPGQNGQNPTQQTVVLDRDRSQPVPASSAPKPAAATTQSRAEPVSAEPVSEPGTQAPTPATDTKPTVVATNADSPAAAPAPTPATATSTTGMWAVQLGSFANQENAERLAASLREQGFAAFLSQLQTDSGALHRVRVGPQKDRDSAEAIAAQLVKSGHSGRAVPHP